MSEKIAIIGTGGTIAMAPNKQGALEPALTAEQLVASAPRLGELDAELDVFEVFNMDSSDIAPKDWGILANKVSELHSDYDGILVTHGTDTMTYGSTALSFALGDQLSIPVVFTGSQQDIQKLGNDVQVNLERSMKILLAACEAGVSETMIVFSKSAMRAARTVKGSGDDFDAFVSPNFDNLAGITATEKVRFSRLARKRDNLRLPVKPHDNFDDHIVKVAVMPGLRAEYVQQWVENDSLKGLIFEALGTGNVPGARLDYSLLPVIERAVELGKPVILSTGFEGEEANPATYVLGRRALEAGAGHAGNMTSPATWVKLQWLLGQGLDSIEKINQAMLLPYVGEIDKVED